MYNVHTYNSWGNEQYFIAHQSPKPVLGKVFRVFQPEITQGDPEYTEQPSIVDMDFFSVLKMLKALSLET